DLAVILGRRLGHPVRADRAVAGAVPRWLLGRRDGVWSGRANAGADVRGLPAARSAGRGRIRDEPGPHLCAGPWAVGARNGGFSRRADRLAQPAELAAAARYSITRSARSSSDCGISIPIDCAAFRLITNSNPVGSST